jgi:putative ABC transport system substrate-binding protein
MSVMGQLRTHALQNIIPTSPQGWSLLGTGQMVISIGRRQFISALGGTAFAWPLAARAQRAAVQAIGYLNSRAPGADPLLLNAFRQGLKEAGFIEGQNVAIEYRFAENNNERLPELAADLVGRRVAVIVANGPAAAPAKAASNSIPIVFAIGFDPVSNGLVASLNRPGGNVTGVVTPFDEIGAKKLELAHELIPAATNFAVLLNSNYPSTASQTRDLEAAARSLSVQLHILSASSEQEFDTAFATVVKLQLGALVIGNDPFFNSHSVELGALAARSGVPGIFQTREFAAAGGLTSYGPNLAASYYTAGTYVGRILKGEAPATLPVQQSTKFDLVINLKAAKALGLSIPQALLATADEVIE